MVTRKVARMFVTELSFFRVAGRLARSQGKINIRYVSALTSFPIQAWGSYMRLLPF